jgi:hypothetical protein
MGVHSKASARAIRAGLDITAQGGWCAQWRCTYMSAHDGLGPSSLADSILLPVTAHCRGATTTAVFATGYTPRSVGPARHLHTLLPASSVTVTAHCRGATTTAVFATGYTPRSVGPARHLYKFLSSSRRVCAPLLLVRHPRVP